MRICLLLAAGLVACHTTNPVIDCDVNTDCLQGAIPGRCEPSPESGERWCAFPDPACVSGERWGAAAGDGLDHTCVEALPPPLPDAGPDAFVDESGAYRVTEATAVTPSCQDAGVPPPELARLELANDGGAVSVDSQGRRVAAQWRHEGNGVTVTGLKVIGWGTSTAVLAHTAGGLKSLIAWSHGGSICDMDTRFMKE